LATAKSYVKSVPGALEVGMQALENKVASMRKVNATPRSMQGWSSGFDAAERD
jgi:hypothetical protein